MILAGWLRKNWWRHHLYLVDQSAERGVSFPPTCRDQIFKLFIHFLPLYEKQEIKPKSCFSFCLKKIKNVPSFNFPISILNKKNEWPKDTRTHNQHHLIIFSLCLSDCYNLVKETKQNLIVKSQGMRAQLKQTLISMMVT